MIEISDTASGVRLNLIRPITTEDMRDALKRLRADCETRLAGRHTLIDLTRAGVQTREVRDFSVDVQRFLGRSRGGALSRPRFRNDRENAGGEHGIGKRFPEPRAVFHASEDDMETALAMAMAWLKKGEEPSGV